MQTHISTTILFSWLLGSSVAARLPRPRCDVIRCAISKPPPKPVPPRPALGAGARAALPPRADVAELLELFNTLPVHWGDADERGAHQPALGRAHAIGLPLPDGGSSDLSIDAVARAGKRLLATPAAAEERQEALAALSAAALAAGRARSARLAYELCARRVGKWRATNSTVQAARSLVSAGLLATLATRDRGAFERVLATSQDQWEVDLAAEPSLLSASMIGACAAGWEEHTLGANMSLLANGLQPTTDAANARLEMVRQQPTPSLPCLHTFPHVHPRLSPSSVLLAVGGSYCGVATRMA
jgi:hypothetical protein